MNYDPDQPYEQIPYDATSGQPPASSTEAQQPPSAATNPSSSYTNPAFYTQPAPPVPPVPPAPPYPPPVVPPGPMVQPMPPYQPYQPYMPPPHFQPQPPQPKKSRKGLWITLSIIGGIILLGCIGCSVLVATNFGTIKQIIGPSFVTGEYYASIQQQQYDMAFSFLASNASITIDGQSVPDNQAAFVQAATNMDAKYGPVTSFSVQTTDQNFNQLQIQVTRKNHAPYLVTLTFVNVNGTTKIASISNI